MACTEANSPVISAQPNYTPCSSCGRDDRPCVQAGQSISDVHPSTASSVERYRRITRLHGRSWQDSFDFQEFGFSNNVADVAPADELFYKGQILPLQTDTRLHVVQSLSSCCMPVKHVEVQPEHAGRPSSVNRDDHEVRFTSCRIEGAMYEKATSSNMLVGMRSLSFRSHHSGYWESSGEKDTTDTSYSSSRDSSGSSQDSYFPNASTTKPHSHLYKAKPSIIPWKSFFGSFAKVSGRQHSRLPSPTLPIVAFSEDLSKYRLVTDVSFPDTKAGLASFVSGNSVEQEKLGFVAGKVALNQLRPHGGSEGKPAPSDGGEKGKPASIFPLKAGAEGLRKNSKLDSKDKELQWSSPITPQYRKEGSNGRIKVKFLRLSKRRSKSKCTTDTDVSRRVETAASGDPEGSKQRRSLVKERWQGYARKLKPLYEAKKGLVGQFRMDECGKNACEVESGIVRRPSSWQRKLSHQSSFFKNHKQSMEHDICSPACTGSSSHKLQVAMSSCPPSTRSSPNHSGILAGVGDNKAKHHQSAGNSNHAAVKKVASSECNSMSTMHELQSAVQSAIAHCKESNRTSSYMG